MAADLDQFVDVSGIRGVGNVFMEQAGNLLFGLVDRRHDDVAGLFAGKLDDVLAHVGFDRLDAVFGQMMVELGFLADHRLALDRQLAATAGDQALDDRVRFFRRFRPVHLDAVAGQVGFQRFQQFGQFGQAALADGFAQRAQLLQLGLVREHGRALAHQEVHRTTETLAQQRIVHRLVRT